MFVYSFIGIPCPHSCLRSPGVCGLEAGGGGWGRWGVAQGMSGSPIIQDGRIIGAVTHVFVSDPTQGYGVYVDWMMGESNRE